VTFNIENELDFFSELSWGELEGVSFEYSSGAERVSEYFNSDWQQHRVGGPAVEYADGGAGWWQNGLLHRTDGPAVTYPNGYQEWWVDGKRHRDDGPAVTKCDGTQEWWIRGILKKSQPKL
jgi:hypothetical protein